ncbi:MAG: type II toxin-antitoxin system HicA family toxin [Chloroflexi bacterium]|nr:type II toxin-antitoxin system HicA family toxin [Chloroflexota bacterium]
MNQVPRGITARHLVRALRSDGFVLTRTSGSHRIYRHPDGRRVVVAYHGLKDLFPIATLKGILADAGWTDADLRRLGLMK